LPKSADELAKIIGKLSQNGPFYFRSAGHLFRKVGKIRVNDLRPAGHFVSGLSQKVRSFCRSPISFAFS